MSPTKSGNAKPKRDPETLEIPLMKRFLGEASSALRWVRFIRRQVLDIELEPGTRVTSGISGMCDTHGYLKGTRIGFECEFKSASGDLSQKQKNWRDFCIEWGIPWYLLEAHWGETPEQTMDRWIVESEMYLRSLLRAEREHDLSPGHERCGGK